MAETIYHVIDDREKRVFWGHYRQLDAVVAALSQNPSTIKEFGRQYAEIAGEDFFTEGPETVERLLDYLVLGSEYAHGPIEGYNYLTDFERSPRQRWCIYKKTGPAPLFPQQGHIPTLNFLQRFYVLPDSSPAELLRLFHDTIKDFMSFQSDEKTPYDIPELTPELIREWEQSPHREEYLTANDYCRNVRITDESNKNHPIDGIVVADLRKRELRYISEPGCFDIPLSRPTDFDKKIGLHPTPYTIPPEWIVVQE